MSARAFVYAPDALECTHCRVAMTESPRGESPIRYFCCPRCGRWASSAYAEVLRAHAGARAHREPAPPKITFDQIKMRMDRWMERLDADPHRVLGVSAQASPDEVRGRYRQLALEHHPDRGGDAARMRQVNEAYDLLRR